MQSFTCYDVMMIIFFHLKQKKKEKLQGLKKMFFGRQYFICCSTIHRAKKYFLRASRRQGTSQYNPDLKRLHLRTLHGGTTAARWWRGEQWEADEGGRSCDLNVGVWWSMPQA